MVTAGSPCTGAPGVGCPSLQGTRFLNRSLGGLSPARLMWVSRNPREGRPKDAVLRSLPTVASLAEVSPLGTCCCLPHQGLRSSVFFDSP